MKKLLISSATAIATLSFVGTTEQVQAATTYFGSTTGSTGAIGPARTDFQNATAASNRETLDFETPDVGTTVPFTLNVGNAGTATVKGQGEISTGNQFLGPPSKSLQFSNGGPNQNPGDVTLSFSQPSQFLSFDGFDFGDGAGEFSLQFQFQDESSKTVEIPYDRSAPNNEELFFGVELDKAFTEVKFQPGTGNGIDRVAVDNLTVESEESTSVPEPGTGVFWLGVIGVGTILYRRKSKSNMVQT
jgi:hypothetical protein